MKKILSFVLLLCASNIFANSNLTYQYSVPYSGGAKISITNRGPQTITIAKFNFTTNAFINANPYGTLWGWQSAISNSVNPDGVTRTYSISENPTVTITPQQTLELNYSYDAKQNGGPLTPYNVASVPTNVSIVEANSNQSIMLDIYDKCVGNECIDPGNGKKILGYYPDWAYWRSPKFTADKVPYQRINTVVYAFSIFDRDGKISLYDQDSDAVNIPHIQTARLQYPYLNASLSFGGWSWFSTPPGWLCQTGASPQGPAACFAQMAADTVARSKFIRDSVQAMRALNFNGIDIDWEYPEKNDADNFVSLLQDLRRALDDAGKKDNTHYNLTIAAAAGIDKINRLNSSQWKSIANVVDSVDVMTYDFHGAWDQGQVGSDFMSAMQLDPQNDKTANDPILGKYNVVDAMDAYLSVGVKANKLLVGIPAYARLMTISSAGTSQGLYQNISGIAQGEWDNQSSGYTGMIDYQCVVDAKVCGNNFVLPKLTLVDPDQSSFGRYAKTPWGFASTLFITYDDAKSAAYKAKWVKDKGFGGVMVWDFTGDFPADDSRSMIGAIYNEFKSSLAANNSVVLHPRVN